VPCLLLPLCTSCVATPFYNPLLVTGQIYADFDVSARIPLHELRSVYLSECYCSFISKNSALHCSIKYVLFNFHALFTE